MANEIWLAEEAKFLSAIQDVRIPNSSLDNVALVTPRTEEDFNAIPESGGCYWIWTNEPILHSMHRNPIPAGFDNGEIIYNGIAKDNVRHRAKHHLFGQTDANWSGISVDIHFGDTVSHRKKAWSDKGKVPYIKESLIAKRANKIKALKKSDSVNVLKPVRSKDDFLKLNLSNEERALVNSSELTRIFFRNGININQEKHRSFEYRIYYITDLSSLYLDFIEKKWRQDFGLPKLCSYSSGR